MKYQVMPELTPIEYEALKADIAERGVLVPVEVDENGDMLDGHHRVKAWQELRSEGVNLPDYPRLIRSGLTEEQKRNHARSLNVLRRHLSKEQRDEVMRQMRADGATYQQIADAVGVSYGTAHSATKDQLINSDKLPGADGKYRPATYERKPEAPPTMFETTTPVWTNGTHEDDDESEYEDDYVDDGCWNCKHRMTVYDGDDIWICKLLECTLNQISAPCNMDDWQEKGTEEPEPLEEKTLPLTASNHAVSSDPNYDGDEWYTPFDIIQSARALMGGIDIDPASCDDAQELIRADAYLTKGDDALQDSISWTGRMWLNPPYSMPLIRQFIDKAIQQYECGNVTEAVIITNNSSDTAWFHELLSRYPACFTKGRVKFWRPNHDDFGTRQGQTLFYMGNNVAGFVAEFNQHGQVVIKA